MRKPIKTIVITAIVLISLIVLVGGANAILDHIVNDMHGELAWIGDNNLSYHEQTYYRTDLRFQVRTDNYEEIFELGWQRPVLFPDIHYYAFNNENPPFIFSDNSKSASFNKGLWVRENYDLYGALYTVEDSNIEITLTDAMTKSAVEVSMIDTTVFRSLYLYLKDDPRIEVYLSGPYELNDNWYVVKMGECWLLSEEFVGQLKAEGVINP